MQSNDKRVSAAHMRVIGKSRLIHVSLHASKKFLNWNGTDKQSNSEKSLTLYMATRSRKAGIFSKGLLRCLGYQIRDTNVF